MYTYKLKVFGFLNKHSILWIGLSARLIGYLLLMSCSRIFHLYGDVNITGDGLQSLGVCSALRAFEQGGIFIVPHLL
jgi:hypothetical protein